MPRSNDLKIEISEIFGDEVSESLEPVETTLPPPAGKTPSVHIPTAEEFEEQFVVEEDVERNPHFQESPFIVEEILASPDHETQETAPSLEPEDLVDVPSPEVGREEVPSEGVVSVETDPSSVLEGTPPSLEDPPEPPPAPVAENRDVTIDFGTFNARPFARPAIPPGVKPKMPSTPIRVQVVPVPSAPTVFERPVRGNDLGGPAKIEDAEETERAVGGGTPLAEVDPLEEEARLQRENEYLALYDQFRLMIHGELLDLVGDKKTKTMLSRTLEATRNKYPDYFRNANWDDDGNLLEDGSMDIRRLVHNKTLFEPGKADALQDLALKALLEMRLLAVEKGMGASMRTKLHLKMRQWSLSKRDHEVASGNEPVLFNRLLAMLG